MDHDGTEAGPNPDACYPPGCPRAGAPARGRTALGEHTQRVLDWLA